MSHSLTESNHENNPSSGDHSQYKAPPPVDHLHCTPAPPPPPVDPPSVPHAASPAQPVDPPPRQTRKRRGRDTNKSPTITPPHPWATDRRAKVYTLQQLEEQGLTAIRGQVQCNTCNQEYDISHNLIEKYDEVSNFIFFNMDTWHNRAPPVLMSPRMQCVHCSGEEVKPIIEEKKRSINWLFLLLGQMIGHCKHEALKYYCKHNGFHSTGAKDRLLYIAYLNLCKQLCPNTPFDIYPNGSSRSS